MTGKLSVGKMSKKMETGGCSHAGEDLQYMQGETGYLRMRRVKQRLPDPCICILLSNTVSSGYRYSYRGRNNQLHPECDFSA